MLVRVLRASRLGARTASPWGLSVPTVGKAPGLDSVWQQRPQPTASPGHASAPWWVSVPPGQGTSQDDPLSPATERPRWLSPGPSQPWSLPPRPRPQEPLTPLPPSPAPEKLERKSTLYGRRFTICASGVCMNSEKSRLWLTNSHQPIAQRRASVPAPRAPPVLLLPPAPCKLLLTLTRRALTSCCPEAGVGMGPQPVTGSARESAARLQLGGAVAEVTGRVFSSNTATCHIPGFRWHNAVLRCTRLSGPPSLCSRGPASPRRR